MFFGYGKRMEFPSWRNGKLMLFILNELSVSINRKTFGRGDEKQTIFLC